MTEINCPLCGCDELTNSWLSLNYDAQNFNYVECGDCRSLICSPMPSDSTLRKMYDASYCGNDSEACEADGRDRFDSILSAVADLKPGVFVDYGCGDGQLLRKVRPMGWEAIGVEFNPELSSDASNEGIRVFGADEELPFRADVLHLGDVLEHLTDLPTQFPEILKLVKPGGTLIAHGPLEANPNLFFKLIRFSKKLKGNAPTEMPPYHVILATTDGQRRLFDRAGLVEQEFQVSEVAFPAVESLSAGDLFDLRKSALYALRKFSQAGSAKADGNRYLYIGKKL